MTEGVFFGHIIFSGRRLFCGRYAQTRNPNSAASVLLLAAAAAVVSHCTIRTSRYERTSSSSSAAAVPEYQKVITAPSSRPKRVTAEEPDERDSWLVIVFETIWSASFRVTWEWSILCPSSLICTLCRMLVHSI